MNSHMDAQEAEAKNIPRVAWEGNREADRLADAGAKQHAISEAEMGCYEWARATAHLVRTRIAECTKDVINRRPGESRELKRARHSATKARRARRTLKRHYLSSDGELRPRTTHDLQRSSRGGGWRCRCCQQTVTRHTALSGLQEWFATQCPGPPPAEGGASASTA